MSMTREPKGRKINEIRPIELNLGWNRYAEGSALIKMGHTHVLCTASTQDNVPSWRQGSGMGWVTAEYSMLPRATHTRGKRDREKVSGRTQEIQRLIGRALRGVVDLKAVGERSILIDCDVLQADGGTRTASINGGFVALVLAAEALRKKHALPPVVMDSVCAISVGLHEGEALVDLDYPEDSSCDVDMNFVVTGKGEFVEIQGTGEGRAFTRLEMQKMTDAALTAAERVRELQFKSLREHGLSPEDFLR